MKRKHLVGALWLAGTAIALMLSAGRAAAQGPAGHGAAEAQQDDARSTRSLNPMSWMKKDPGSATDALGNRSDLEKKLTPGLQSQSVLAANANATDACVPFATLDSCLAVLHASHNLGVDFVCLRADVTGVNTTADVSKCKVADGDKAQPLNKAIHQFKPEANAKQATKDAEGQAKDDLKTVGG